MSATPLQHAVIILAGGAGTRLRPVTGHLPKAIAPVNGKPFLWYLLEQLHGQGFRHVVLALGVGAADVAEAAQAWQEQHADMQVDISAETEPLGTGGAILRALSRTHSDDVLVLNGDTLLHTHYPDALPLHQRLQAACTLMLVQQPMADRYGTVTLAPDGIIQSFAEKEQGSSGLINAGAYWLRKAWFLQRPWPEQFSWEQQFLAKACPQGILAGYTSQAYFIDIGTPADYEKAQYELKQIFPMLQPQPDWTLFLDRDGVINIEKQNDYIHTWDEFVFYDDAVASIAAFSRLFARIIVVTNQKGVGKGVTKPEDLAMIHQHMVSAIEQAGGRIDAIYFCPDTSDDSPNRKPNPGMAFQARADHPGIDLAKSVIIGNNLSDMQFGRNAGMHTVFLRTTQPNLALPEGMADMESPSLHHLVKAWGLDHS